MERTDAGQRAGLAFDARSIIAIAVMLIVWSSAYTGIRVGLAVFAPGHMVLLRFLIASAALAVFAVATRLRLPDLRDIPLIALLGLLGITGFQVLLTFGETTVTAGSASLISAAEPMFTALLAAAFIGERLRGWGWAGIIISFAGVALITVGEGHELGFNLGAIFVLIAAFVISVYAVFQKPLLKKYSPMEFATYAIWAGTFFMLVFTPGFIEQVAVAPLDAILAVSYLGVFPGVIGNVAWAYALSRGEASQVAASFYLLPVLAIIIAWGWIGEVPSLLALLGGGITLAGVVLVGTLGKR